jgi:hypothetical protein
MVNDQEPLTATYLTRFLSPELMFLKFTKLPITTNPPHALRSQCQVCFFIT